MKVSVIFLLLLLFLSCSGLTDKKVGVWNGYDHENIHRQQIRISKAGEAYKLEFIAYSGNTVFKGKRLKKGEVYQSLDAVLAGENIIRASPFGVSVALRFIYDPEKDEMYMTSNRSFYKDTELTFRRK